MVHRARSEVEIDIHRLIRLTHNTIMVWETLIFLESMCWELTFSKILVVLRSKHTPRRNTIKNLCWPSLTWLNDDVLLAIDIEFIEFVNWNHLSFFDFTDLSLFSALSLVAPFSRSFSLAGSLPFFSFSFSLSLGLSLCLSFPFPLPLSD